MKLLYSIIALLLSSSIAFAQTPETFNYQAVIGNGSGEVLVNTTVALRISVLQDSDIGAAVFEEVYHPTTNDHGLVNLAIGDASFYTIDWGAHDFFLKVEVDPNNGSTYTHLGTSPLLSVPYALHARTVQMDQVDDADPDPANELQTISLSGSELILSPGGGSVMLPATGGGDNWGTQAVESDATLLGDGTSGNPLSVVGDLTDDQTLSISGNDLSISDGNTVTLPGTGGGDNWGTQAVESDATLSGDGTSGNPLGVVGDLTDDQTLSVTGNDLTISSGNTVSLPSSPWLSNASNIYYNSGNVGINTSNPQQLLHVNGIGRFDLNGGSVSLSTPGGWPGIIAYEVGGKRRDIRFDSFGLAIVASTSSASPANQDGITIRDGGNVGIQTSYPGNFPLYVNQRDMYGIAIYNSGASELWEIYSAPGGELRLFRANNALRGAFDGATGVYTPVSDRRFKTEIRPMGNTLTYLKKLEPSSYLMKDFERDKREIGLVAQDLKKYFPELVFDIKDERSGKTYYTINYGGVAVVAVKAIQEQQEIIDAQAETIEQLSEKLEDLERRFESLQRGARRLR